MSAKRQPSERAAPVSEAEFRSIVTNAPVGIGQTTPDGRVTVANQKLCEILGLSPNELIGRNIGDFVHPEERGREEVLIAALGSGKSDTFTIERRYLRPDQGIVWTVLTVSALRDADGNLTSLLGVVHDITARKQAEANLRALSETLEQRIAQRTALLRLLNDVTAAANRSQALHEGLRSALERICREQHCAFGQVLLPTDDGPDVLVSSDLQFVAQEERRADFERFAAASRIAPGHDLAARVFETGEPAWITDLQNRFDPRRAPLIDELGVKSAVAFPVLSGAEVVAVVELLCEQPSEPAEGALETLASIGTQLGRVVERERASDVLRRAERLASLGTFAAGIAHEVNNPLSSILMSARYALRPEQSREAVNGLLREIIGDTERCAQIVRDVRRFAQNEPGERVATPVADVLQRAEELTRRLAEQQGVQVQLKVAQGLAPVVGNTAQLEQGFVNIFANAIQASKSGEVVLVRASGLPGKVRVQVSDQGRGMEDREREHAFDPFYTTRSREGGSGLGLSLARGIFTGHRGSVEIKSQPGHGTTVVVELPTGDSMRMP